MKKIFTILFFLPLFVLAQKKYTTHTVASKESLFSIGRLYNINPRELAKLNNIDYEKGLALGQVLKVPDNGKTKPAATTPIATTPSKEIKTAVKPTPAASQAAYPVYHTVAKKETLYHISTLYGKVPVATIKKWNNLTGDGVNEGTRLIVGYTTTQTVPSEIPVKIVETPQVKVVETPNQPVAIDQPKVAEIKEIKPVPITSSPVTGKKFDGGFFKNSYAKSSDKSEETGMAGIFKSTSGWEDGKYYCLHNAAQAGSIVKITNTATKKSVYAKVLDVMPDLKQNEGLLLRISNAAAEELGAGSSNFECIVTF